MNLSSTVSLPASAAVAGNVRAASGALYAIYLRPGAGSRRLPSYAVCRPGSESPLFCRFFAQDSDTAEEVALQAAISYAHSYDARHANCSKVVRCQGGR